MAVSRRLPICRARSWVLQSCLVRAVRVPERFRGGIAPSAHAVAGLSRATVRSRTYQRGRSSSGGAEGADLAAVGVEWSSGRSRRPRERRGPRRPRRELTRSCCEDSRLELGPRRWPATLSIDLAISDPLALPVHAAPDCREPACTATGSMAHALPQRRRDADGPQVEGSSDQHQPSDRASRTSVQPILRAARRAASSSPAMSVTSSAARSLGSSASVPSISRQTPPMAMPNTPWPPCSRSMTSSLVVHS